MGIVFNWHQRGWSYEDSQGHKMSPRHYLEIHILKMLFFSQCGLDWKEDELMLLPAPCDYWLSWQAFPLECDGGYKNALQEPHHEHISIVITKNVFLNWLSSVNWLFLVLSFKTTCWSLRVSSGSVNLLCPCCCWPDFKECTLNNSRSEKIIDTMSTCSVAGGLGGVCLSSSRYVIQTPKHGGSQGQEEDL